MILDDAEKFLVRYNALKDNVGGIFFLTATEFEEIENSKSNEEYFISQLEKI